MEVLVRAFQKYLVRDTLRGGLWREAGAYDNARNVRGKAIRLERALTAADAAFSIDEFNDDLIDLINYAVFLYRNTQEMRFEAEHPIEVLMEVWDERDEASTYGEWGDRLAAAIERLR